MPFMCFGTKTVQDPGAWRNEEIEKMIRRDQKERARQVKMLLLGAGESGKSTVIKQMKILHKEGFSRKEREEWRAAIFNNLVTSFQNIIMAMEDYELDLDDPDNKKYEDMLNPSIGTVEDIGTTQPMPPTYLPAFTELWADLGVQKAVARGNEYALHDNLFYFFIDLPRLFAPDYLPTDQDILRARVRTSGINEMKFDLENLQFWMFDVGGQRSERKKWINCFEDVHVVMFLAAISGYDQAVFEDNSTHQMNEALTLFETIVNSQWFRRSAIILFLNKIDLFREKVETGKPITKCFPDYEGDPQDPKASQEFIANKFRQRCRVPGKELYVHYTNATDTDLLKKTMRSVQDMIVQRNLNELIM